MARAEQTSGGFDDVQIPIGGGFWRALGGNGSLILGYVLAGAYLGLLVVGTSVGPSASGARLPSVLLVATSVLPLLAASFLWVGELIRRGRWGGPSGHKPDAFLPQGSTTVRVRLVPVAWHVVWVLLTGAAAAVLLTGVSREVLAGSGSSARAVLWSVHGPLLAAVAGAVLGSLVKKLAWARRRSRAVAPAHPALARRTGTAGSGRRFWRWFGYRWRLDLWFCGLGAATLWAAGWVLAQRAEFPDEAGSIAVAATWLGIAGAVLFTGGIVATTQFWRAGEDIASAESVA